MKIFSQVLLVLCSISSSFLFAQHNIFFDSKGAKVSGKKSRGDAPAAFIATRTEQKVPLYPEKTPCKAQPGTFNVYLQKEGKNIGGQKARAWTGVVHFCDTQGRCDFCSILGNGHGGLSDVKDGNTPPGVYETFPITHWPKSRWGSQTPFYLAPVLSSVKEVFTSKRSELAWHEKPPYDKDASEYVTHEYCRTSGCLKSKTLDTNSPAESSCLARAQAVYADWAKSQKADSSKDPDWGQVDSSRRQNRKTQALETWVKRMGSTQIHDISNYDAHPDHPSKIMTSSDDDQKDWRGHISTSMHTIVSEHEKIDFDLTRGADALRVEVDGKMLGVCL